MQLTSAKNIKNLFKEKGIKPSKKLGQSFLASESALRKIIDAAQLKKSDIVLEIGPGIGTLTKELAQNVKQVIAIEKDSRMIEVLKDTLKSHQNIKIVRADILRTNIQHLMLGSRYKLISNLPYYITNPIIRKFLENTNPPLKIVLMVQKEVAQRIYAQPPKMNLLAITVQFYTQPEIISWISKRSFWPQSKVDSAIVRLEPRKEKFKTNKDLFFRIIKAGFAHPRKQLVNNLSYGLKLEKHNTELWLEENKINPKQRVQTLYLSNWLDLTITFPKYGIIRQ